MHELWIAVDEGIQAFDTKATKDVLGIPFSEEFEVKVFLTDKEFTEYEEAKRVYYIWMSKLTDLHYVGLRNK
jgi:hypothetical protein